MVVPTDSPTPDASGVADSGGSASALVLVKTR
jgi:hypothetical protein